MSGVVAVSQGQGWHGVVVVRNAEPPRLGHVLWEYCRRFGYESTRDLVTEFSDGWLDLDALHPDRGVVQNWAGEFGCIGAEIEDRPTYLGYAPRPTAICSVTPKNLHLVQAQHLYVLYEDRVDYRGPNGHKQFDYQTRPLFERMVW